MILGIYTTSAAGEPMRGHDRIAVSPGAGLAGDRYASGGGHWSYRASYVNEITFIEAEAVERLCSELGIAPIDPARLRRNVVTRGVALQGLIAREFAIGDALFRGVRPCDPCAYLEGLLGIPLRATLAEHGGLRASVVRAGTIAVSEAIVIR
ncbi:hypothetical protein WPS_31250 [Vulcanimicrobium alpinum]|uniref:MOSC domain-containing protein n=1 Tax=Vulcanimicrobium alpinum TaxID=3016050 RepID=A0AAN1XYS2_UNVUL|nr:MOSC domain-containing protein [Vulcanimicrobium alpinum]BDE07849.1 hypothetical protein WPS_31250 [Vulcanimicrobium alpinum]